MGTRSITILQDASEQPATEITVLYRQHDGYPSGMGQDILSCLGGKTVVNGYSADDQVNGPGDMCVQLIAWLKNNDCTGSSTCKTKPLNTPGSLYLHPPGTRDMGEEYTYTLSCTAYEPIHLTVSDGGEALYDGPLDAFDPEACESPEEEG